MENLNKEDNDKIMSSNKEISPTYDKKGTIKIEENKIILQDKVKNKEVAHLIPHIKLIMETFGDEAFKLMFGNAKTISLANAKEKFIDFIGLSNLEANTLARFIIEPKVKDKIK